jgi:hypothetical protein
MATQPDCCSCSFQSYVGGSCSFDKRDKTKSVKLVNLLSCNKDITSHKKALSFSGVSDEVDLILARSSLYSVSQSTVAELMICPSHRSKLGVGWCRSSQKCCVPHKLSKHTKQNKQSKWPRAERGIGKEFSIAILRETGIFVTVGSGE